MPRDARLRSLVSPLRRLGPPLALVALTAAGLLRGAEGPAPDAPRFRLGFTYSNFSGVNENDARASIKALVTVLSREKGIPADPEPRLYHDANAAAEALNRGDADAIGMTTQEFWQIRDRVATDRYLTAANRGDSKEEYLLLVHRQSGISQVADLRDHTLTTFQNARASLGRIWLDVILARAGLPESAKLFSQVADSAKQPKCVLDVFFHRTDACLVTRRGYALMVEMNPQVGQELVVLAQSPRLLPGIFVFRAGFDPALKAQCLRDFPLLDQTTAGQQALTIFQVGAVAVCTLADADDAFRLLDENAHRPTSPGPSPGRAVANAQPP